VKRTIVMGNEAQAVCLMVELTRVGEVTIPLWDARDRHCGARLAIAHLSPTIPQQTWFRGVVAVHVTHAVGGGIRGRIPSA